jgi:hypothetical protein
MKRDQLMFLFGAAVGMLVSYLYLNQADQRSRKDNEIFILSIKINFKQTEGRDYFKSL